MRVIETWGPFPIQPVVVRTGVSLEVREAVRAALLRVEGRLSGHGLAGFAPLEEQAYHGLCT